MKIKSAEAFQLPMGSGEAGSPRCAFVRIESRGRPVRLSARLRRCKAVSPSLGIIARDMAPYLVGKDVLDHAILLDTLFHADA